MPNCLRHRWLRWGLVLVQCLGLCGCGAKSNVLGLTTPREHKETFEVLLDRARVSYDHKDLAAALKYSKKAYEIDPNSEDAAILYGFVNLSLAGGDPFSLAEGLTARQASEGGGTSDTLSALKTVIGLSDADLVLMSTRDESDPELPVLVPACAEDARRAVKKLHYINSAVNAVCRFIDDDVRVGTDYRQNCRSYSGPRRQRHRGH